MRLKCLWVSAITKNAKHYAKSLEKPSILITTFSNCSSLKWSKPNKSQTLTPNLNNASSLVHKIKIKCLNQIYWMRYKHELFFFLLLLLLLFFFFFRTKTYTNRNRIYTLRCNHTLTTPNFSIYTSRHTGPCLTT